MENRQEVEMLEDYYITYQQEEYDLRELSPEFTRKIEEDLRKKANDILYQLENETEYRGEQWAESAKRALMHTNRNIHKIEKYMCADDTDDDVRASVQSESYGLDFTIRDYTRDSAYDEALASRVAHELRPLEAGQVAEICMSKERVKEIRAVMPRVVEILGWRKVTGKSKVYRTITKDLPNDKVNLRIFRF